MGAPANFLVPGFAFAAGTLDEDAFPPELRRHLQALRVRNGERVRFLDGRGGLFPAVAAAVGKKLSFRIEDGEKRPPLAPKLTLCLAPPKGDDLWTAVQQATEVGASRISFVKARHAQVAKGQNAPVERARRVADAACEQCGRAWRLEIEDDWRELVDLLARPGIHVVADEILAAQEAIGFDGAAPALGGKDEIHLYIGPEGGWSDEERRLFDGRAARLGLGSLVLRVPTACVAAIHFLRLVHLHNAD